MDLGLSGRTALVTGASKGIGRATALALAGEGMVNTINPGTIETGRLAARIERHVAAHKVTPDEAKSALLTDERVARFGNPEEVAALVTMIASQPMDFLQGAIIEFDGGKTRAL